jgi:anti-sigma factor RsiW
MTMNRKSNGTLAAHDAEHKRVSLDLPWYINGTLDPVEHGRVAAHIAGCLVCRRELSALGALDRAVANRDREPQVEAALGRLHQRIAATSGPKPYFPWAAAAVLAICKMRLLTCVLPREFCSSSRSCRFGHPRATTDHSPARRALMRSWRSSPLRLS